MVEEIASGCSALQRSVHRAGAPQAPGPPLRADIVVWIRSNSCDQHNWNLSRATAGNHPSLTSGRDTFMWHSTLEQ